MEAFPFPITTVPFSIATPDQEGHLSIIKELEALHTIQSEDAAWLIDSMALIRCLKPKNL